MTYSTADRLGYLAARCELQAADANLPELWRLSLTRQAEKYRAAQEAELAQQAQPYPLANVLLDPRPFDWTSAVLAACAVMLLAVALWWR